MRGRSVLILLFLVVALVAFIELYEHKLPSSEERAALGKLVLTTDPIEIMAIEITSDGQHVRLERQGKTEAAGIGEDLSGFQWHLVEPMTARADSSLVVTLIESLTSLEKKRVLEDANPAELGLDPPRLVVDMFTEGGQATLLVGSEVPAGNSMIVTAEGDEEVQVVDNLIWSDLNRDPGEWRDRQVLDVGQKVFQRIVLKSQDKETVLVRRGEEFWLEGTTVDRADSAMVGDLLTALVSMRVDSFLDSPEEAAAILGLDPFLGEVEIATAQGEEPLRLTWGSPMSEEDGQSWARLGDQVFSTETDLAAFFEASLEEWRSLDLTTMETFQIDALEIDEDGHGVLGLSREGANWRRNEARISFTAVSDLLYAIADARAIAVRPERTSGPPEIEDSKPRLVVLLRGAKQAQSMTFYPSSDESVPVVVSDREVVLIFDQDEFTEILANVERIRAEKAIKTDVDEQLLSSGSDLSTDQ